MNIEFHYTITWLIAARAGLRGDDLRIFSYSSQYTDDNDRVYSIRGKNQNVVYRNRISQTMNIFKPRIDKFEIYPLFHFIPGDINALSVRRSDGKMNPFNVTPNSRNANRIMDDALATGNFYRIGIAAHAYADTWAHQNFAGYWDRFNAFGGFWNMLIPNCGHADAKHKPDLPRLEWQDARLVESTVDNRQRFLDAAAHLFDKLWPLVNTLETEASFAHMDSERRALADDLSAAMGDDPKEDNPSKARKDGYRALAAQMPYGSLEIPAYDEDEWRRQAIRTKRVPTVRNSQKTRTVHSFCRGGCSSDWFKFQEAVKAHADCAKAIICENPAIAAEYGA